MTIKQLFRLALFGVVLCLSPVSAQISSSLDSPQTRMVGARIMSLGGTNPIISGDTNGLLINPATLGSVESMPLALTTQTLLGVFDYKLMTVGMPFDLDLRFPDYRFNQRLTFGFSYASMTLEDIPETFQNSNNFDPADVAGTGRFWSNESYSGGFRMLYAGAGTEFYNIYGFNNVAVGVGAKIFEHYVKSDSRSTFGLDAGVMSTYHLDYFFVDKVHIGAAIHNIFAFPLVWADTNDEATLPFQIFLGGRVDILDESMSIFGHSSLEGVAIGTEYYFENQVVLRGSASLKTISFGTGLIIPRVAAGFGNRDYSLRLDYNYTQNQYPNEANPNHTISISILGETRPKQPKILFPDEEKMTTRKIAHQLSGIGPKNTSMRIYNNGVLSRTSLTNRFGYWTFNQFPLKEGDNLINVKSYSIVSDQSQKSNDLTIVSDTIPPELKIEVVPAPENKLRILIKASEKLVELEGKINNRTKINFIRKEKDLEEELEKQEREKEKKELEKRSFIPTGFGEKSAFQIEDTEEEAAEIWSAVFEMPRRLRNQARVRPGIYSVQIFARDSAGNNTDTIDAQFFMALEHPNDKYVHYRESLRFIGYSSAMVKTLFIDGEPVKVDENFRFSHSKRLKAGKNLVKFTVQTLNDKELNYTARILRLVSFPDLSEKTKGRREIEFLATLGAIVGDPDKNFYPDREVTRQYIAKLIVETGSIPAETVPQNLFSDVPSEHPYALYIQTAILNGLMFPLPDGTFQPDQPLTLSEAIFLLSNAGVIQFQELRAEKSYITRSELAQFLAYTPRNERAITRLINWKSGYKFIED